MNVSPSQPMPSRRNGTPPGYKNVRVLVPQDLHWRLLTCASNERKSLPQFVLERLSAIASLDPLVGPSGPSAEKQLPDTGMGHAWPLGLREAVNPQPPSLTVPPTSVPTHVPGTLQSDSIPPDQDTSPCQALATDPSSGGGGSHV
jgi:hypothetical protein